MKFLSDNIGTIVVLGVFIALFMLALRTTLKNKNSCNKCENCSCKGDKQCDSPSECGQ